MLGQIHLINVYTADDDYTVPVNPIPLRCRMCHNTLNTQMQNLNSRERQEKLAGRRLQYPVTFDMPDNARIAWLNDPTAESNITYWNVEEETESAWHGVGGPTVVNTCQVEKINALF